MQCSKLQFLMWIYCHTSQNLVVLLYTLNAECWTISSAEVNWRKKWGTTREERIELRRISESLCPALALQRMGGGIVWDNFNGAKNGSEIFIYQWVCQCWALNYFISPDICQYIKIKKGGLNRSVLSMVALMRETCESATICFSPNFSALFNDSDNL